VKGARADVALCAAQDRAVLAPIFVDKDGALTVIYECSPSSPLNSE